MRVGVLDAGQVGKVDIVLTKNLDREACMAVNRSSVDLPYGAPGARVPHRRTNLKDELASYIRDQVFSANLKQGVRVDQDAIAQVFGTSKLPVREALILLEAEGLIVNIPNRGSFVAELTPEDFRDSYLIVGNLSAIAARRAASRISDDELQRMSSMLEVMDESEDVERAEISHHEFHRIVNLAGGSLRLNKVLRTLSNAIPERLHYATRSPSSDLIEVHAAILKALEEHDPEAAAEATIRHFESGASHAVEVLSSHGFWDEGVGAAIG